MIQVIAENTRFTYLVANKLILKERFQSVETRIDNARWIQASDDERLTLVTCWPYESNTHRVIVVAIPIGTEVISLSDID
jgi:sortase A